MDAGLEHINYFEKKRHGHNLNYVQIKNPVKSAGNIELVPQFNNRQSDLDSSLKVEQAQLMKSVSWEKVTRILWEMYTILISFVLDNDWPRNVIHIDLAVMMIRD